MRGFNRTVEGRFGTIEGANELKFEHRCCYITIEMGF